MENKATNLVYFHLTGNNFHIKKQVVRAYIRAINHGRGNDMLVELINSISGKGRKKQRIRLYRQKYHTKRYLDELVIYFRPGRMKELQGSMGWTDGNRKPSHLAMANILGYTPEYIRKIHDRAFKVSDQFLARLRREVPNYDFHYLFDFYDVCPRCANDPAYNRDKSSGKMPYTKYSHAACLREQDQ